MDEHVSERARTYEEALRLVEAFRLFAAPQRFIVSPLSWEMDARHDPMCGSQATSEFRDFWRAPNGCTEIDIGDRFQLGEPFDIEFTHTGFVVWSAATVQIARPVQVDLQSGPQLLAPRIGEIGYGVASGPTDAAQEHHEAFVEPNRGLTDAIAAGAPITGLVEFEQFPLEAHGWRPAEIDVRFPPVSVQRW